MRMSRPPISGLVVVSALAAGLAMANGACTGEPAGGGTTSSSSSTGGASSAMGGSSGTGGSSSGAGGSGTSQAAASSSSSTGGMQFDAAGLFNDGGFAFDANFEPYSRPGEEGVECGVDDGGASNICAPDGGEPVCCIDITNGAQSCNPTAMCGSFTKLPGRCDGPEDCGGSTPVCCFTASQFQGSFCTTEAECMGGSGLGQKFQLCNHTADCPSGSGCCRSGNFPDNVQVGTCQPGCNL